LSILFPRCPCDPSYPVLGAYCRFAAIVKRLRAPRCLRPSSWPPTLVLPLSSVCVCASSRIASLNSFPLGRNWKSGLFLPSSQCLLRSQSGASTEVSCRTSKPEQQVWLSFRAHVGWFLRKFLCFVVVLLCGVKTLPPWPLRGRARTKNLLKATKRRAPTGGRDFRNCPALANKTIAEGTPIRQYRANHDFGVPPLTTSTGWWCSYWSN
jgi:hypothetical protein